MAAGAILGAVVLTGAGVATATAATQWISSWAATPVLQFTYTLPSGATCESRFGALELPPELAEQESALLEYLAALDVMDTIDVDTEIATARADRNRWRETEEGVDVPAWYGTENYPSPDREYSMAVQNGIHQLVLDELARRDLEVSSEPALIRLEGETKCPGAEG